MAFACIDIGGTNTLIGVGDGPDAIIVVDTIRTAAFLEDMTGVVQDAVRDSGHSADDVDQVAVAGAGPIDRDAGAFYPPNIAVNRVSVRELAGSLDASLSLMNDCSAAVLGEYVYGQHDVDSMVYLTISTGIGAGVIVDGRRLQGRAGNVGEIGHMVVGDDGISCGCGGRDHWEAYCSGVNLPRMADHLFGHSFEDSPEIFAAYDDGDGRARDVVQKMQALNVRGVMNVAHAFDPELIAVGGGVALHHESVIVDHLQEQVGARFDEDGLDGDAPRIETCALRDHAVLHGLQAYCSDFEQPE